MFRLALTFLMVSTATCYVIKKYNDHCNGLQCPKYNVTKKTDDYEVRVYPSYKWATASTQDIPDYKEASSKNFMKLFRYISGENVEKKKVEMTAPVLVHIPITQGPFCAAGFTMHFFVPNEFQANPPQPLNNTDQVQIMELPEFTVYVGSFSGYMTQSTIIEHEQKLGQALIKDGVEFDATQLFTAGYDSPFKPFFLRHNEVMFLPKENAFKV